MNESLPDLCLTSTCKLNVDLASKIALWALMKAVRWSVKPAIPPKWMRIKRIVLSFLFRLLRNETALFSVQGWTIYIVICKNPIRVKFVIVNVNTVEIRSSQQNVAFWTFQLLLYSKMGNYACNSRFSLLKYTSKLHTFFYSDSNRVKEIYFGDRETARPRDLSTSAIKKLYVI